MIARFQARGRAMKTLFAIYMLTATGAGHAADDGGGVLLPLCCCLGVTLSPLKGTSLQLLLSGQASLGGVLRAFGLLIPWVLAFALPMGMLTAALLVFGRFSADQELTAVRAGGVSLVALITPILLLSLLLCGASATWINMEIAPRCRVAFKHVMGEMGLKLAAANLPEGRYTSIPGGTA